MKLHNLSDVRTPRLEQLSMVNVSVTVGGKTIAPGGSESFRYIPAAAARFIAMGVLASGEQPPAAYLSAKAATKKEEPKAALEPEVLGGAATDPAPPAEEPEAGRRSRRFRGSEE